MRILFILQFVFATFISFSQQQIIDSIPTDGIVLNKSRNFKAGDNKEWAKPDFDDKKWQAIDPTLDVSELPQLQQHPIGWLQIHFHVNSSLLNKPLAYHIFQSIASQVFINGKLTYSFGVVSLYKNKIKEWRPSNDPECIVFTQTEQTVAVKFSLQHSFLPTTITTNYDEFIFRINDVKRAAQSIELPHQFPLTLLIFFTFFLLVSIINLVLYVSNFPISAR